jgi:hypothetical protein
MLFGLWPGTREFGPVREYLYPLQELDSSHNADFFGPSVIDILVSKGTLQHAKLLCQHPFM